MSTTATERHTQAGTSLAVGLSVLALLLSGWSLVDELTDDADREQMEQRLVCLELPGPNDCGPGR